jgi:hypothetical protein
VLRCRKSASHAAAELKQSNMLAKVARGSHGSSPSNCESNQTDGVSQTCAAPSYDEPGFSIPMAYSILPKDVRDKRLAEANKAWAMLWFVHGLSFNLINSPLFRAAILATKRCPAYKPCHRHTLATTHLDSANEDANVFKASRLASGKTFGFLVTSDGWRNHNRRQYHNFILVAASGPIYLGLKDVSGESGNAQAIHDEFVDLFETLANDIVLRIIIGCTDTPSANVSAWKKLEVTFPNQLWIGCMAHELSLLFKDWVKKIPEIKELYVKGKRITIWIKNHGDILKLYQNKVKAQWPLDKRHWPIMPYMPGDTRMATCFKLVHRLVLLKQVLQALVTDPAYHKAAQAAITSYNSQAKAENKVQKLSNGSFPDVIAVDILDSSFWLTIDTFMAGSKTSIYFLRMVDSNLPVLGKVFYTCALINKQLKYLAQSSALVKKMYSFFTTRWSRWHKSVHVLAYALDPSYQSHILSAFEYKQCTMVLKRIRPDTWTAALVELKEFKRNTELFDAATWAAVDHCHGYLWWDAFGGELSVIQGVACDILSKQCSASSCEFNWSSVSSIERKGRGSMVVATTNKSVNVAAMHRLSVGKQRDCVQLPTLDAIIEQLVEDVEDDAPVSSVLSMEEAVFGNTVVAEAPAEEEEEVEDVVVATAEELEQLERAQALLLADWSTRDTLLD